MDSKLKLTRSISVIGLGKLGTPFLATLASRGFKVIGVDVSKQNVALINNYISPVQEPEVSQILKKYSRNIRATTIFDDAISNSQITFIIVPTPSKLNGAFTNEFVIDALVKIGEVLKNKSTYHLIAIVSTVMPGSTDQELRPALEKAAGKKTGSTLGLCYNPSFIALGDVVHNLLEPDFVLIGESDYQAGNLLSIFYQILCLNKPAIRRMNFINAEISKLALNTYITTKISYANMLADICEKLPGADVDTVTSSIGCDSRVGLKYLKGAIAYGGPCFPRDNRALTEVGKKVGVDLAIANATDAINQRQSKSLLKLLYPYMSKIKTVGIIGLSYKPNTTVTEESQGIKLIELLKKYRKKLLVYGPLVENDKVKFTKSFAFAHTLTSLISRSDALIVTLEDAKIIKELQKELTKIRDKNIIVLDCWRALAPVEFSSQVVYIARGRSPLDP